MTDTDYLLPTVLELKEDGNKENCGNFEGNGKEMIDGWGDFIQEDRY